MSDLTFLIGQGSLPWQPILGSKLAKSANSPSFVALTFRNGNEQNLKFSDGKIVFP